MGPPAVETALVADIPVLFARPETTKAGGRLALWMHFLGGSKEAMVRFSCGSPKLALPQCLLTRGSTGNGPMSRSINC